MPHGLDHIVHAVRDLDAAADVLCPRRLYGRRAQSPSMGHSQSHCAVEELLHRDPRGRRTREDRAAWRALFFVRRLQSRLSRPPRGVFDAAAQQPRRGRRMRARSRRLESRHFDVFDFAREGQRPDGTHGEAGVLAGFCAGPGFAERALRRVPASFSGKLLESGVSDPRQRRAKPCPARSSSPTIQSATAIFLKAYTGVGEVNSSSIGVTAHTENGDIEILESKSLRDRSGISVGYEAARG